MLDDGSKETPDSDEALDKSWVEVNREAALANYIVLTSISQKGSCSSLCRLWGWAWNLVVARELVCV